MAFRTTNFLIFFFFEISNFNAPPKIPCIHFGEWLFWTYLHKIKSWRRECVLKNPLRWTQAPQIHSMPRSATGYPCPTPPPSIEANVPGWRDIVAYKRGRGVKKFEKTALIQVFVSKSWKGRLQKYVGGEEGLFTSGLSPTRAGQWGGCRPLTHGLVSHFCLLELLPKRTDSSFGKLSLRDQNTKQNVEILMT